ncbi:MAG: acyl-CoA thioesterase II [Pseudomonadales bacterium]|nr:acyl-CoA thioesterase II [Pseudomonadales bacterium]
MPQQGKILRITIVGYLNPPLAFWHSLEDLARLCRFGRTKLQLEELLGLLDLEQVEENLFRAFHPEARERRLYGGQIMAQALVAAARTASERVIHSVHGYFLRPGDPKVPAIIKVERLRDGGSFSSRRVVVVQNGEAIFNMDLSFQAEEAGLEHQDEMPDLRPPVPEKIPEYLFADAFVTWRHEFRRLQSSEPQPPEQFVWFKCNGEVPNDPLIQASLLLYESDNTLLGTARLPHRGSYDRESMQVASLDHAMWFHGPFDLSEWMLYAQDSPSTSQSRGLTRGRIFTQNGRLVANTIQEGLIRIR